MVYRVVCRYFGFTADWENWGENDRMSEGWGAGKGKDFSFPSPFPNFSFSLPHLVNFLPRPNSPLYQDGGLNSRWKYISTRPTKIRLHCRLPLGILILHLKLFLRGFLFAFFVAFTTLIKKVEKNSI